MTGEGTNRQTERIKRQREAVPLTEVGSQCRLTFKLPGISPFDLGATVTSPGGVTEAAEIGEVEDGLYGVNFVPKELGVHTVSVKYQEMHIPGSPFQFTVSCFDFQSLLVFFCSIFPAYSPSLVFLLAFLPFGLGVRMTQLSYNFVYIHAFFM